MRCGCPVCDTYMVQSERGLSSGCVCPACLAACRACMGGEARVLTPEALRARQQEREQSADDEGHLGEL